MKRIDVCGLPEAALDAARAFQRDFLEQARSGEEDLLLVFAPADHTHREWRRSAVQALACEAAPRRVNGVAASNEDAVRDAAEYFAAAPGITGQYLLLG